MNAALIIKWKLYLERLKKTRKISCEKFSFRRFRIRENMWWPRYRACTSAKSIQILR